MKALAEQEVRTDQDIAIKNPPPLFSAKTMAEFLAVPEDTVQKWRAQGRLPQPDVRVGSKLIRWKYETIMALVKSGQFLN
jgi:excisionase family DNA binding protein